MLKSKARPTFGIVERYLRHSALPMATVGEVFNQTDRASMEFVRNWLTALTWVMKAAIRCRSQ